MTFIHWLICLPAILATVAASNAGAAENDKDKVWVFIGTYTQGTKSKGIYRSELDLASGKLSAPELAVETTNPSFLAIHPSHKFLYSVGEISNLNGKNTGAVNAFSLDPATGKMALLNQQTSSGAGPCHLVVDKAGKNVLVANYGGGSASALPIEKDGKLGEPTSVAQHKGKSVVKGRQEAPHAHSVNLDAANNFAFVADLGLDQVLIYNFDSAKGTITPHDPPAIDLAPGAGPRHFAFHPGGKLAFVINEIDSTLTSMHYDPRKGSLTKADTASTLPEPVKGNSTAEVVVHPSGKFVYGSNRGHNSIAVFSVDAESGKLKALGHQGHLVKTPRNFAIDPTGRYLLVGSQASGQVIAFRINEETGTLTPSGGVIDVAAPVCIRFMAK